MTVLSGKKSKWNKASMPNDQLPSLIGCNETCNRFGEFKLKRKSFAFCVRTEDEPETIQFPGWWGWRQVGSSSARGCSQTILCISAAAAASTVHRSHSDIGLGCFDLWTMRGESAWRSTDMSSEMAQNFEMHATVLVVCWRERLCVRSCLQSVTHVQRRRRWRCGRQRWMMALRQFEEGQ